VDQAQDEAVAAQRAVARGVEVSPLRPVLDHEHQRTHAGIDAAVGAEELRVRHGELVVQRYVALQIFRVNDKNALFLHTDMSAMLQAYRAKGRGR
jgi:hypothetical protein